MSRICPGSIFFHCRLALAFPGAEPRDPDFSAGPEIDGQTLNEVGIWTPKTFSTRRPGF